MNRIDGDGTVRIGIDPCMGHCRIVHGQNLNDTLFRLLCPIHQKAQIAQVTDTKTLCGAQGEDRNHTSSSSPRCLTLSESLARDDHRLPYLMLGKIDDTVIAILPIERFVRLLIPSDKFVFQRIANLGSVQVDVPIRHLVTSEQ